MGDVNYSLISAVREGNYGRVKQLIDGYGLSYSRAWSGGYTLLLDALRNEHTEVAKLLLTNDCKVNSRSQKPSDTPLHLAVDAGDVEIVKMLLDRGANIGVENKYGQTPLYNAIICKNIEVTELFLKHRADVNARNKDGESPLHVAASVGCLQIAELLLKSGANVHFLCTAVWKKCYSPLHVAVEKGSKELVMLLLSEGANVDVKAENNMTPLLIAAKKGHVPIAKDLLNHGACINSLTLKEEYTPLHFACEEGDEEAVKLFLDRGADPNASTKGNVMPLQIATKRQHYKIVRLLLQHGAKVDHQDQDGKTILHLAVEKRSKELVMLLVSEGANVDIKEENNMTPLLIAAKKGHVPIAKDLLNHGACINSSTLKEEYTSLHFACEEGDEEAVKLFLDRGADPNASTKGNLTPLQIATKQQNCSVVRLLLEHGAKVDHQDQAGKTILHLAVEKGSEELVMLLLSEGANSDVKAKNNMTPLHIAAKKRYLFIAEDLLNHGACINSLTLEEEYTPLHFACEEGDEEDVKLFLDRGADPNASTKGNLTPLQIATKKQNCILVRLLLQHGAKVDHQDQDGKTVLYHAVTEGNLEIFVDVLKYCPDISNKGNRSSLTAAVQRYGIKHQMIVKALLKYGFSIGPEDANVPGLLHAAVAAVGNAYLKIVKDLLKYGADVNSTAHGCTPLHIAAKIKQEEIAKLLISHEADVNAQDKTGKTAIFYAIDNVDVQITKLLLNSGANVKDNPELLNIAAEKGCIEIVEALLQYGADVNISDTNGRTALHFTASRICVYGTEEAVMMNIKGEIAKLLLSKGANINSQTKNGETPLHVAAGNGCAKVVQALLEYNANNNSGDTSDITRLHRSGPTGREEICTMFLNKAAYVNAKRNNDGMTALHIATQYYGARSYCGQMTPQRRRIQLNYLAIIETILKFGADVDCRNKYGRTALHIASQTGQVAVVKTLLEYGSDINIMDKCKNTPFDDAVREEMSCNIDNNNRGYGSHSICSCKETVDALNLHIVKMKTANLYVSEQNLILFRKHNIGETKNYFKECEVEILSMKNETIDNSNISYYAILAKDISSLALCTRNENVMQVLKSGDYKAKFPIYGSMIQSHFRKALERHDLLEQASGTFHFLFNNFPELPYDCTEKILNYLSNDDLRLFYGCMLSAS